MDRHPVVIGVKVFQSALVESFSIAEKVTLGGSG
jgi:hypothetical protein